MTGRRGGGSQQWQAKAPPLPSPWSSAEEVSSSMRNPVGRTKVVVRRLPPTLSKDAFVAQIDASYAGTYSWLCFHPGKSTPRKQLHSRAYINFNTPEDVYAFHGGFDGHVFVNEKGSQYKAMVEYAPFQRVPDLRPKKDGREGIIYKDPLYLEFLEMLAKPVELLPSAEVQLERREAERLASGAPKDTVIVTPLMEFVRGKMAAKGPQRSSRGYRSGIIGASPAGFVKREGKSVSSENTNTRRELRKREYKDKKAAREASEANGSVQKDADEAGKCIPEEAGRKEPSKKKLLTREKEKSEASSSSSYVARNRGGQQMSSPKHLNYRERPGRAPSTEPLMERRPTKSRATDLNLLDDKGNSHEARRVRNKDRPDRPVWTPRRRLDNIATAEQDTEGGGEVENELDGRNGAFENGAYKHGSRKAKDTEESGKHAKKGAANQPFANNEKQVWVAVQKSGSGP